MKDAGSGSDEGRVVKLPWLGAVPLSTRAILADLASKGGPLWAQMFKFALCGALTTVIFMGLYFVVEWCAPEYIAETLDRELRQRNLMIVMVCAFIPVNLLAFWINRTWIFHARKHGLGRELAMFFAIAAFGFIGGEMGKRMMVNDGYSNLSAVVVFAVASACVNFFARRLLVFGK